MDIYTDRYTYEITNHGGVPEVQIISPSGTVIHFTQSLSEALAIVFKMNKKRRKEDR